LINLDDALVRRKETLLKKVNALQIACSFPPKQPMGALRNYRIADLLAKHFGNLHIITSKKAGEQVQSKNMIIRQIGTFDYKNVVRLFKSKSGTQAIPEFKKPSVL